MLITVHEISYSRRPGKNRMGKTDYGINEEYPNYYHQYQIIRHSEISFYFRYINSSPLEPSKLEFCIGLFVSI